MEHSSPSFPDRSFPPDSAVLDRYYAGAASAEDLAALDVLREQDPAAHARIEELRATLTRTEMAAISSEEIDRACDVILADAQASMRPASGKHIFRTGRPVLQSRGWSASRWIPVASLVVLVLAAGGILVGRGATDITGTSSARNEGSVRYTTRYTTTVGQRATVVLADGSRITLAPGTTLQVSRRFNSRDRSVRLNGQAYFSVATVSGVPFLVHTGHVVTRVLGTGFDVRHYAGDRDVRVVVASGKVAMQAPRHAAVTLASGMMGHANDSAIVVSKVDDVAPYTSWTDGHLRFRDAPVPDVLATLGRWYGVQFQVTDTTLADRSVTAALDYSATGDLVFALETILNVTATSARTADRTVITLAPRRPTTRQAPSRFEMQRRLSPQTLGVGR